MKKMLVVSLLVVFSQITLAAVESTLSSKYDSEHILNIYKNNLFRFEGEVNSINKKPVQIAYLKFQNPNGMRGTVLISAGRAESALKFIELAEDFIHEGYSTVYVLDQRGQGLSTRLQKNKGVTDPNYEKVHLDQSENMTLDMATFINNEMTQHSRPPYMAVGHITGALPLVNYMQLVPGQPVFEKVVLVSPLFKLKTGFFEQALFDYVIAPLYSFSDDSRVPFQKKKNQLGEFAQNNRTQSQARFDLVKNTIKTVPESFSENSTVRWAKEIFGFQKEILSQAGRISTPVLIITAKADELLDNSVASEFCKEKIEACQFVEINQSKHWVLFEKDSIRNKAMQVIFDYLKSSTEEQALK